MRRIPAASLEATVATVRGKKVGINEQENLMLRCRDIVDLLGEYLDGGLEPATAEALRAHLADCRECTAFINTYRGTTRATRRLLKEEKLPPALKERLLTFLSQQRES